MTEADALKLLEQLTVEEVLILYGYLIALEQKKTQRPGVRPEALTRNPYPGKANSEGVLSKFIIHPDGCQGGKVV